jgi:hypothetical protein
MLDGWVLQDVLSLLRQALPDRTPVVSATTAFHDVEPLSVKFTMNYDATWPSAVFSDQLESRIQSESLPTPYPGLVEVPVSLFVCIQFSVCITHSFPPD